MACPDMPGLAEGDSPDPLGEEDLLDMADTLRTHKKDIAFIKGFVDTSHPMTGENVQELRNSIFSDYRDTVFSGKLTGSPPIRGTFGEAEIELHTNTLPVSQRAYPMTGEKRDAWIDLTDQLIKDDKIEPGQGPWCSPSFPVPKKNQGHLQVGCGLPQAQCSHSH